MTQNNPQDALAKIIERHTLGLGLNETTRRLIAGNAAAAILRDGLEQVGWYDGSGTIRLGTYIGDEKPMWIIKEQS